MDHENESRIVALETKATYVEDTVDELNRLVYRQQLQIERLTQQIRALYEQIQAAMPNEQRDLKEEIPPHY